MMIRPLKTLSLLFLALILLAGCAPAPAPVDTATPAPPAVTATGDRPVAPTPTLTPVPPTRTGDRPVAPTPTAAPTLITAPQSTPTATVPATAPRLAAERWQEWPVIPAVTRTFIETYRQGLALGMDPRAFSKIGDCQSVVAAFFGVYDQPGVYQLPKGSENLQETIDWFKGSWGRESEAVRGGFNVASVLSSFLADPKTCKPGESPLDCEFRQNKPSMVLISMETGFEGRTAAVYEKYMRKIIEYALQHGAAPILATKADNFEGDQSINLVTARLALEYDLPLWNFWRAVQPLPDHGMDAVRSDKFHISVEAWNERSFTALQALDALWRAVQ